MRASVVVPARDAEATLPRTLAALAQQQLEGEYEVIVVDDGSRDRTAEIARAASGPVTLFQQEPQGPATARNLGVAHARSSALAFCDADVYPTPGWLAAGLKALGSADLVQGRVLPDPEQEMGPFDRSIWILSQVGLWETANLFVRRGVFETVGGFEEWIKPRRSKALAEDVWFGYKARRSGATSTYCAHALAYHEIFSRSWLEFVIERLRLRYFPAMARKVPELRQTFLYRRVFLNRRTARADLALAAVALATACRSPLPRAATSPYLRAVRSGARRSPPDGPPQALVAGVDVLADVVGLLSMAYGSLRYRSPVL